MIFKKISKFPIKWNYTGRDIEKQFQREVMLKLQAQWFYCFHPTDVGLWSKFLDLHIISPRHLWTELGWIEFKQIKWKTEVLKILDTPTAWKFAEVWIYSVKMNNYVRITFKELWRRQDKKWSIKLFE